MDEKQLKKEARELRNVSHHNKVKIKNKRVTVNIDGKDYDLRLHRIGPGEVTLHIDLKYKDIVKAKDDPLERKLWSILTDVYEDTKSTTIGERRVFI